MHNENASYFIMWRIVLFKISYLRWSCLTPLIEEIVESSKMTVIPILKLWQQAMQCYHGGVLLWHEMLHMTLKPLIIILHCQSFRVVDAKMILLAAKSKCQVWLLEEYVFFNSMTTSFLPHSLYSLITISFLPHSLCSFTLYIVFSSLHSQALCNGARAIVKVSGHQYQRLAGGYELEIGHF